LFLEKPDCHSGLYGHIKRLTKLDKITEAHVVTLPGVFAE
jgi:hypothetical protein